MCLVRWAVNLSKHFHPLGLDLVWCVQERTGQKWRPPGGRQELEEACAMLLAGPDAAWALLESSRMICIP